MHDQPKIKAYREADFFADRRGMRPIPENTVARGFLNDDDHLFTGKVNGQFTDEFPFQVTRAVLQRGHDRFAIYCTPCHGQTGMGNGMVVQRGFRPPPSFHTEQIRKQTVGYWYDVMTNGFGAMPRLPRAGGARGSLGDRGLHPRPATEPARHDGRRAARQDQRTRRAATPRPAAGGEATRAARPATSH